MMVGAILRFTCSTKDDSDISRLKNFIWLHRGLGGFNRQADSLPGEERVYFEILDWHTDIAHPVMIWIPVVWCWEKKVRPE